MKIRVVQSVQCLTADWTAGLRSPTEAEDFSSNLCVQTGSGAHPASYIMGTGGSLPGGKARLERDADHSPPSSAEAKKEWELHLLSPRRASMERNGTTVPYNNAGYLGAIFRAICQCSLTRICISDILLFPVSF
jgi:hypothetical protein